MAHFNLGRTCILTRKRETPITILQKGKSNGPQTVVTICSLVCLHVDESQEWVLIELLNMLRRFKIKKLFRLPSFSNYWLGAVDN